MLIYRDSITRVSVLQARALSGLAPRLFKKATSVPVVFGSNTLEVKLRRTHGHGCVTETTVFACPRCDADARVIAFSAVAGIGCLKCMPWRSREYPVSRRQWAPGTGNVRATL